MAGHAYLCRQSRFDLPGLHRVHQADRRARRPAGSGSFVQQGLFGFGKSQCKTVTGNHADIMAQPFRGTAPHFMGFQSIGNKRRPRHLHRQRTGIRARGFACQRTAFQQHHIHAAPCGKQGNTRPVNAPADNGQIMPAHNGAGSGTGISA